MIAFSSSVCVCHLTPIPHIIRADRVIILAGNETGVIAALAGLRGGRVVQRFNCFYNTTAEAKVAKDLFAHAVNFYACKPLILHAG